MAKKSYPLPEVKNELKITPGKPLEDARPGKEISEVWTDNDLGAIRGTRKGFS